MRTYRFYKDEYGWFIDLKWFPFNRAHLAMVCGADELLDKLSKGGNEVRLKISTNIFKVDNYYISNRLERVKKLGLLYGAVYEPSFHKIQNKIFEKNQLWLCAVTLLVFGHYPKNIYYSVV